MSENIIDKVNNDSNQIVITTKSVKWILGLITTAILFLGGLAWGLYVKVDGKVDKVKTEFSEQATTNQKELLEKIEDLEKIDVKENTTKNYKQDSEIGILLDRTNSRNTVNNNATRPPEPSNGPVMN